MRPMTVTRRLPLIALAGTVCFMAACGMDPPPAPGQQPAGDAVAEPQTPAGLALVERNDLTLPAANATGVRCNIETLGGQAMESVRPSVAADRVVAVLGWYAMPSAPAATAPDVATAQTPAAATDAVAVADPATAGNMAASAPVTTATRKPMLVIASEDGSRHWAVPLPELRLRRDVAKAFDDPALGESGFDMELDMSSLRPGFYNMHLSDDVHSAESVCGLGRGFVIK